MKKTLMKDDYIYTYYYSHDLRYKKHIIFKDRIRGKLKWTVEWSKAYSKNNWDARTCDYVILYTPNENIRLMLESDRKDDILLAIEMVKHNKELGTIYKERYYEGI